MIEHLKVESVIDCILGVIAKSLVKVFRLLVYCCDGQSSSDKGCPELQCCMYNHDCLQFAC